MRVMLTLKILLMFTTISAAFEGRTEENHTQSVDIDVHEPIHISDDGIPEPQSGLRLYKQVTSKISAAWKSRNEKKRKAEAQKLSKEEVGYYDEKFQRFIPTRAMSYRSKFREEMDAEPMVPLL